MADADDTGLRIRPFTLDDYEAASVVWDAAERMDVPTLDEVRRKLERDEDLFLVAEDGTGIVGVLMGTYDARRAWIFRLAVHPGRRRRGTAAALVRAFEDRCAQRGIAHLRLLVLDDNEPALAFWEEAGYRRLDRIVMFSKDLDEPGPQC